MGSIKYIAEERKGKAILKPLRLARRFLVIVIVVLGVVSPSLLLLTQASPQTSILRPNATGTYTEWTTVYPASIAHWDAVDDVTADDAGSYIETATKGHRDTFNLPDIPSGVSVSTVKVYARHMRVDPSAKLYIMIITHSTNYTSPSISAGTTWTTSSYNWTTNPYTGANWTAAEVNALEAGVQTCEATKRVRVTQVYVEVTYTLPAVAPIASFTYSPSDPFAYETITFNASASYDPDGTIVSYRWDFGDDNITTVTDPVITHFYVDCGNFTVTLTVTDNDGLTDSSVANITVLNPTLHVSLPAGTVIGPNATDPWLNEGWLLNLTGTSGTFTVRVNMTSAAHYSYDTHLVIDLNDAGYNNLVSLTVNSTPVNAFQYGTPQPYGVQNWSDCVYPTWFNDTCINLGTIPPKGYVDAVVSVSFSNATNVRMHFDAYGKVITGTPTTMGAIAWSPHSEDSTVLFWPLPVEQYYLTVKTDPADIVTIPGEGWYANCTYVNLTAPAFVPNETGVAGERYRFDHWTVDGDIFTTLNVTVHMDANHTATAHYVKQYLVTFGQTGLDINATGTVVTVNGSAKTFGNLPFTWWVDNCSWIEYSYSVTVLSLDPNENFTLINVTGPVSPFHVEGPVTVTGNYQSIYKVQYYLDVSSNYGTPGGMGWYDDGDTAYATLNTSVIDHGNGTRRVFTHWSGDASGTNYAQSNPITMDGNKTAIANWKTQYYLTVISARGTPGGEGWYNASDTAYATITPLTVNGPTGVQYVFTGWSGDASGSSSPSDPIVMNGSKTAVANWKTQYYLTVTSPHDSPTPTSGWFDNGTSITASVTSPWPLTPTDTRYICTGWTGTGSVPASGITTTVSFTINAPSSITWTWKTQYLLVIRTDPPGLSPQPTRDPPGEAGGSWWYDNSTNVNLTAQPVTGYVFLNWDIDGSNITGNSINVHMDGPHTATAQYVALRKCVVDFTEDPESPIYFGTKVTFTVNVTQKAFNGTHEVDCTLYVWNLTDPNGVSYILKYGKQWNNFSDAMNWTFNIYGHWTVTLKAFCNDTALIDAGMAWSDPASHPKMVIQPVGGYIVPVCKLDLLVPWTGFVLGLMATMAVTIALFRLKSRKH